MFVPIMKFVGSLEFEILTIVWRKLLIFMKFYHKSAKGISKRHTKFKIDQTFKQTRAEIYSREVNREL